MKAEIMIGRESVNDLIKNPWEFLKLGLSGSYPGDEEDDWVDVQYLGVKYNKEILQYMFAVWSRYEEEDEFLFNQAYVNIYLTTGDVSSDYYGNPDEEFPMDFDEKKIQNEWNKYVSRSRVR
jgi:hypothetical protein